MLVLVCVVAAFEAFARRRIEAAEGANLVGVEVYDVVKRARTPGAEVERIYLGDSVARQFFPAGHEPHTRTRFLTSNATISLAGNFYLAEAAFEACPRARDVVLLLRPEALQVNLDPPYTNDYFSGFFHSPAQIAEMWKVKRDLSMTVPHVSRWILPATLAINSAWRQEPRGLTAQVFSYERPPGRAPVVALSAVSSHFVTRLRSLVGSRGGTLRILSVPLPDDQPWDNGGRVFDDAITYVERSAFGDGIHLGPTGEGVASCVGTGIARRFADRHGLSADLPFTPMRPDVTCEDSSRPAPSHAR